MESTTTRRGSHSMSPNRNDQRARRPRVVYLSGALIALLAQCSSYDPDAVNVVLITVDTLRADHLASYSYHRTTSPNVDRLAEQGALFERAYSPRSITWPSLASLMTSTYPVRHGVRINGVPMSGELGQLAEEFQRRGYDTAAFISHPTLAELNFSGFDEIHTGEASVMKIAPADDKLITDKALEWLDRKAKRNTFVWLHYFAPHDPYRPPAEYAKRFDPEGSGVISGEEGALNKRMLRGDPFTDAELRQINALYDEEILYSDDQIGRVIQKIDDLGKTQKTLYVFTSDHGEELADHNNYLFHLTSVYNSTLHVPFIVKGPGIVETGMRIDAVVETIDVAPTVLALLGWEVPESYDGDSLAPLLRGEKLDLGPAVSEWEDKILTLRTGDYSFVYNPLDLDPRWISEERMGGARGDPFFPIAPEELYDLDVDPLEQTNRAGQLAEEAERLREQLEAWQSKYDWRLGEGAGYEIDPELQERLEALGYVYEN